MAWDVYLVTDDSLSAERTTPEIVEAAIDGGVDVVQLRDKSQSVRDRFETGKQVRELTRDADVTFIVNDRVDLVRALNADGVHLGADDLPIPSARDLLGPDVIIGRSVSTVSDAEDAERAGADYLGVGAIYRTGSKDDITEDEHEVGPERITAIERAVDIPIVGIGGITPENADAVIGSGADGVAVITAITAAADPAAATAQLQEAVTQGKAQSDQ
jgi:thiamine-phosphate pyrophosphorylase